jgi:Mitochondrial carrier protein
MRPSIDFIAGGVASCVAEVLTLPMDTVKVRLQIAPNKSQSVSSTVMTIIREEGVSSLFNGIKPALLRQALYGSLRYGLYPIFKELICGSDCKDRLLLRLLSGCSAGACASALCNPTDLVKVRMQVSYYDLSIINDDNHYPTY